MIVARGRRMKPPLPVGHGQRLCPGGGAVAASLPTMDWLPGPVERGAGLCVALLAAVENPAEGAAAGGGAERRQWRKKRGGSPVSKGVEGSRFGGDAQ